MRCSESKNSGRWPLVPCKGSWVSQAYIPNTSCLKTDLGIVGTHHSFIPSETIEMKFGKWNGTRGRTLKWIGAIVILVCFIILDRIISSIIFDIAGAGKSVQRCLGQQPQFFQEIYGKKKGQRKMEDEKRDKIMQLVHYFSKFNFG